MIKNLLYSIFLHAILLTIIYANFNLRNYRQDEVIKVAVNLVAIDGSIIDVKKNNIEPAKKAEEEPKKSEDKKPKIKDDQIPKSPKKSNKDQVKKPPKKAAVTKNKKVKENKKPANVNNKNNQFKKPKEDKKDPKTELDKEDQKLDEKEAEIEPDPQNKAEDLGAKKETPEENKAEEKDAAIAANEDNINSLQNINLSVREKFNIQSQLRLCYKRAIKENGQDSQIKVTVAVNIAEDGSIAPNFDDIIDLAKYKQDSKYKIAIDNARRALELCSPLRNLPLDKYDVWKEVLLEFDENMKN
jgi:outer membrane biosynthesis protein TonB